MGNLGLTLLKLQELKSSIHYLTILFFDKQDEALERKIDQNNEEFSNAIGNANMLANLYYSPLARRVGEIATNHEEIHKCYLEAESLEDYSECSAKYIDNLQINFLNIYAELSNVMRKTMH